jgi:hypothetical protein
MTTVQIIAVSAAGAAALLLVIALLVARRRRDDNGGEARANSSFLDEAPQDTFSVLGKAEQPVEDITLDPALERAAASGQASASPAPEAHQPPGGLGLEWEPDLRVRDLPPEPPAGDRERRPGCETEAGGGPLQEAEEAAGRESRLVPLSDIIVTTSGKLVDLQDPDVRRMLIELVTLEIDQAADFRRQGQTIDAVLQLTEADKVARALGMTETAAQIQAMMEELRQGA